MFYRRWVLTLMERNQEWVGLKEEPLLMKLSNRYPEERLSHKYGAYSWRGFSADTLRSPLEY